jgi:hypothetical protein
MLAAVGFVALMGPEPDDPWWGKALQRGFGILAALLFGGVGLWYAYLLVELLF